MTETEKKALALVNEVDGSVSWTMDNLSHPYNRILFQTVCRAIEQHEAFRKEVSDAVEELAVCVYSDSSSIVRRYMGRFILTKPDPLENVLEEAGYAVFPDDLQRVRAALAARGLEIREKQP